MNFLDAVTIAGTKKREDGALIVDARTARTGIQIYAGSEVGKPEMARVNVFRGADEVFALDSLKSYAHRPVTNDHPQEAVTAANWRTHAVGQTADEVTATDIYVRVPLMISDAAMIAKIEAGKRQLSVGYTCDLDWTPGITKDGDAFDARQRNIRVNHIAIVDSGRAGANVRIGDYASPIEVDDKKEDAPMTLKTMLVDGFPIADVSVAAELLINRLLADKAKLTTDAATLAATHSTALAAKDTEIGKLTADLKTATDAKVTPAMLDKMVTDRVILIGKARAVVADVKVDGIADADIRRAVVVAKFGEEFVKDRTADVIAGMFDALTKDVKPGTTTAPADPFASAFRSPTTDQRATLADNGQSIFEDWMANAWQDKPAAAAN